MTFWVVLGAFVPWAALAQSTKAELLGLVRDAGGLPIAEAAVELTNLNTGVKAVRRTGSGGVYSFYAMPPGAYRLTAAKEGFAAITRDNVVLHVGERQTVDFDLRVGEVAQAIEVTGALPLIETGRGGVSFAVEQEKVT